MQETTNSQRKSKSKARGKKKIMGGGPIHQYHSEKGQRGEMQLANCASTIM